MLAVVPSLVNSFPPSDTRDFTCGMYGDGCYYHGTESLWWLVWVHLWKNDFFRPPASFKVFNEIHTQENDVILPFILVYCVLNSFSCGFQAITKDSIKDMFSK